MKSPLRCKSYFGDLLKEGRKDGKELELVCLGRGVLSKKVQGEKSSVWAIYILRPALEDCGSAVHKRIVMTNPSQRT